METGGFSSHSLQNTQSKFGTLALWYQENVILLISPSQPTVRRALGKVLMDAPKIIAPFDLKELGVTDPFLTNYLDLLAFLLQGLPASETLTAVPAETRAVD